MSENDSGIEYLGTIIKNPKNTQEDQFLITPLKPNKSSLLSSLKLSICFDLLDFDNFSV